MNKRKLIRITTVPGSLLKLLEGQLSYMNQWFEVIGISSQKDNLQKVRVQENIRVEHIEMTRQITPIRDIKSVVQLYLFFKKEKPFIVHTHTPKAGTVGMFAAKMAGVPHRFHTVAGLPLLEANGIKRKVLNFVEKLTYACATKVYSNSFGLRNIILEEKFCSSRKLDVIGNGSSNGINTSHFNASGFSEEANLALKESLNISKLDFVFIFVGRLVGDKGINELVKSFKIRSQPTTKLLLVGSFEDHLDPLLPETIDEIKNNVNIISVGFQQDVRQYFAISNALIFPSYREGFPNVVMQAGAMGLPCIVSDINGCNEIVSDRDNGLIIPVKSVSAIGAAMKELQEDLLLYNELRKNARKSIVEKYEQKVVWEAIVQSYIIETNGI